MGSNNKKTDPKVAVALMIKNGFKPLEPYKSYQSPWKSRCIKCKKIVYPSYGNQKTKKRKCQYCAKNKVDELKVVKLMIKANLKPLAPYVKWNSPWKCKCLLCNKIVSPKYDNIRTGKGGCKYCAKKGINYNTPSYIYLITNPVLNAHKVGFGNHKAVNNRLHSFKIKGWKTYKVWNFRTGAEAFAVETKIFKVLRNDLGLPRYLTKKDMPKTGGHAETVGADSISLIELEKIIKIVIKSSKVRS